MELFEQGYHPDYQLDKRRPLFILMSGVPGLGKSLLSNILARVSKTGRASQDESGGDRARQDFLSFFVFVFPKPRSECLLIVIE